MAPLIEVPPPNSLRDVFSIADASDSGRRLVLDHHPSHHMDFQARAGPLVTAVHNIRDCSACPNTVRSHDPFPSGGPGPPRRVPPPQLSKRRYAVILRML